MTVFKQRAHLPDHGFRFLKIEVSSWRKNKNNPRLDLEFFSGCQSGNNSGSDVRTGSLMQAKCQIQQSVNTEPSHRSEPT